jgi:hypothetical protein
MQSHSVSSSAGQQPVIRGSRRSVDALGCRVMILGQPCADRLEASPVQARAPMAAAEINDLLSARWSPPGSATRSDW